MADLTCERAEGASAFWAEAELLLLAHESVHNLIIGLTLGIVSGERSYPGASFLLVRERGQLLGVAVQTDADHPLALSVMPAVAARAVADHVLAQSARPRQFSGEASVSAAFAAQWRTRTGHTPRVEMRQGVYELSQLRMPSAEGGRLVCAGNGERDVVQRMLWGFVDEALGGERQQAASIVERLLPAGHVYLWRNAEGELVSLAARNRETPTTASISMVYTPPERRRRGYAGRVVAGVSEVWLERGKRTCNLYTDLANDTSNSVYRKLGYVQLAESHIYGAV